MNKPLQTHIDNYTRTNWTALQVLDDRGHSEFNGVHRRTIAAFASRHLVWDKGDGRAILTDLGREVLAELEAANA